MGHRANTSNRCCTCRVLLILLTALIAEIAAIANAAERRSMRTQAPNIVLFIADDLTWNDIGPYGGREARTTHLDKLAQESLKLEQAFAASPTCTPSRSSMYTGMFPIRNGAHANHSF